MQRLPHKPEDWPSVFVEHLNAGDLDSVMALYESDARFIVRSGETIIGRDRIRPAVAGMIESKTELRSRVIRAVTIDDIALLYTDFDGTTVDASGKTVGARYKAVEVLRRQPDAAWNHHGRPQRPRMRDRGAGRYRRLALCVVALHYMRGVAGDAELPKN